MATRDEYRVRFDFEVDFANGGGIQGQDFRLDIDGDNISDEELSAYIVRDLRLLMVGEVRILNKAILTEPHKRSRPELKAERDSDDRRRIDLSHVVEHGMQTYPGLPVPVICDFISRESSRKLYSEGTEFQIGSIVMCANTGTYVDSPFHRYADGPDLAELPLSRLADLDAVVVDVTGSAQKSIGPEPFLPFDLAGKACLIRTGWDVHWRTATYASDHPHLTEEAAAYLASTGVHFVGIDSLNIDSTDGGERPVHSILLHDGIPIGEHLTNLAAMPIEGARFSAVPVKVRAMGTFPVRAFATIGA